MIITPKQFEIVYTGFIIGGSKCAQKSITILKTELKLLDKLEDISDETDIILMNNDKLRSLKYDSQIDITAAEAGFLITYISQVPWHTGKSTREVMEVLNWLESLKDKN